MVAHQGGVLECPGHTEAALQLSQHAGLKEGAVLIEIINKNGTMARYSDLQKFSKKFNIELIIVKELQDYLTAQ